MSRCLLIALLATTVLSPAPAHAAAPSTDYELLFADEFDGDTLDGTRWRYRIDRRQNTYINGLNRKENVSVADGFLHIAVRQETVAGKTENTGGGIISRLQFGYGYYESRSRPFMAGTGVHSAFWQAGGAMPNNNIFEIDGYEIDATHHSGDNNLYIQLGTKAQPYVPWPFRTNIPFTLHKDGWFLDGYEYTPEGVIYYDNGKQVASIEWHELTAAQCVWLTALNGCGKVDAARLPGETLFDYFRYYAKDHPGVNLLPNGGFEYNQDKVDAAKPMCWSVSGTAAAIRVVEGDAARDRHRLTMGLATAAGEASLSQSLECIRNGDYQLSALVRSTGGQERAEIVVDGFGGQALHLPIPAAATWTRIALPSIPVTGHGVTITIATRFAAGQSLEVDDIRFHKPLPPGQPERPVRPFVLLRDPIWQVCPDPVPFTDGRRFCFFDRMVGFGDSMAVSLAITPATLADCSPIARIPDQGTSGWAVLLGQDGSLVFRIGSVKDHRDVVAPRVCAVGRECVVTCVFDRGTASIHVDGRPVTTMSGIVHDTRDGTKAGKLGCVGDTGEAIGDVTVRTGRPAGTKRTANYNGLIRDVRVWNRALTAEEIAALAPLRK